jgi:hypothetical protein
MYLHMDVCSVFSNDPDVFSMEKIKTILLHYLNMILLCSSLCFCYESIIQILLGCLSFYCLHNLKLLCKIARG